MKTWPTPKEQRSPNAATNKYLGECIIDALRGNIMVECPGRSTFKAKLLGWDRYSLILEREDGQVVLMVKAPGMMIYPEEGFPKKESEDGQR
jgi:hypothetical protein